MTDSNRLRIASVREASLGVTPTNPKFRNGRITREGLRYSPTFTNSEEIRDDRMSSDPVKVNETNGGSIDVELFYPQSLSFTSDLFASAMFNDWSRTAEFDNSEAAGSIGALTTTTIAVTNPAGGTGFTGTDVKVGHLVRLSGFTNAGNNNLFRISAAASGSLTTTGLTAEATPPATARIKVVGFEGASGDIAATATGLTSTANIFTTLGLQVGQWIKVGGSATANKFGTAANNGFARIIAVAAGALTLDNLPAGWSVDAGAGKTIRVYVSDLVKNGVTLIPETIERTFLGQTVPTYIRQRGIVVGGMRWNFASERNITGTFDLVGLTGEVATTAVSGATYVPVPAGPSMASNVSIGRVAEAGAVVAGPNWVRSASISLSNNLRLKTALNVLGAVDVGTGECEVTVSLETYFGDATLLQKLLAGTPTSINLRSFTNGQGLVFDIPRLTLTDGSATAGGRNQDVVVPLTGRASKDALTNAQILISRFEFTD